MGRSVLIVDDHQGFRAEARAILESDGWDVVGDVADGAAALAAAAELHPDVVLLDVQLPDSTGFEIAEVLAQAHDGIRIVLISARPRSTYKYQLGQVRGVPFLDKFDLSGATLSQSLLA